MHILCFGYLWVLPNLIIFLEVVLKFLQADFFFFTKQFTRAVEDSSKPYFSGIDGIYNIKEYYRNHKQLPLLATDTIAWKRIVINKYNSMSVQFMNDSIVQYSIQPDSTTNSIA